MHTRQISPNARCGPSRCSRQWLEYTASTEPSAIGQGSTFRSWRMSALWHRSILAQPSPSPLVPPPSSSLIMVEISRKDAKEKRRNEERQKNGGRKNDRNRRGRGDTRRRKREAEKVTGEVSRTW